VTSSYVDQTFRAAIVIDDLQVATSHLFLHKIMYKEANEENVPCAVDVCMVQKKCKN
jgi:hypothetical protein